MQFKRVHVTKKAAGLFLGIAVAVSLYMGLNPHRGSTGTEQHLCDMTNGPCQLTIMDEKFSIEFESEPVVEEQLVITIRSNVASSVQQIRVEGINMYMGMTPVIEEYKANNVWRGWLFLGACSEQTMRWKATISFNHTTVTKSVIFTTRLH